MSHLFETINAGNLELVKQALNTPESMKELNSFNNEGDTPVMVAIKGHHVAIAEALIKAGASVNQGSQAKGTTDGYTALHFAARTNDIDSVETLLKHKADINRQSTDGWTPVHCACFAGHKGMVSLLTKKPKIDVNICNEHKIPALFFAASKSSLEMTRTLLEAGADLDMVDTQGDGVLHHCFSYQMQKLFEGSYDMPEAALDVGVALAIAGAPVDLKNPGGHTAFEFLNDDMPAYNDTLKIISHNTAKFKPKAAQWNYMTLVSAGIDTYIAIGLDLKHAVDISEKAKAMEAERVQSKKEKEAERPAGGCPVMKSGSRKRRGQKGKEGEGDEKKPMGHGDMEVPADGSDPSNGQCPFFQKKGEAASASKEDEPKTKAVDTPHGKMEVPADGSDPSGGQCPFFKKGGAAPAGGAPTKAATPAVAPKASVAATPATQPQQAVAKAEAVGDGGAAPGLWNMIYRNRETVLMLIVAFFCGIWFEQVMAPLRGGGGGSGATSTRPLHAYA